MKCLWSTYVSQNKSMAERTTPKKAEGVESNEAFETKTIITWKCIYKHQISIR